MYAPSAQLEVADVRAQLGHRVTAGEICDWHLPMSNRAKKLFIITQRNRSSKKMEAREPERYRSELLKRARESISVSFNTSITYITYITYIRISFDTRWPPPPAAWSRARRGGAASWAAAALAGARRRSVEKEVLRQPAGELGAPHVWPSSHSRGNLRLASANEQ